MLYMQLINVQNRKFRRASLTPMFSFVSARSPLGLAFVVAVVIVAVVVVIIVTVVVVIIIVSAQRGRERKLDAV